MAVQINPVMTPIDLIAEGYTFNKNRREAEKTLISKERLEDGTFRDVTFKVTYQKDGRGDRYILSSIVNLEKKTEETVNGRR